MREQLNLETMTNSLGSQLDGSFKIVAISHVSLTSVHECWHLLTFAQIYYLNALLAFDYTIGEFSNVLSEVFFIY
jgi:hypothetical protein